MSTYDTIVFIGRCQPFHNGHFETLKRALDLSNQVIVLLGSSFQPPTIKNPWVFADRKHMILAAMDAAQLDTSRLVIEPLRDYPYNDNQWIAQVQGLVGKYTQSGDSISLIGHNKDESSYYLGVFPQWGLIETEHIDLINATDLRNMYFEGQSMSYLKSVIPPVIYNELERFRQTDAFGALQMEHIHITQYKERWKAAPFKPTFVTVDAVIIQSGHILLVERGHQPGKGLLALPGGFLEQDETTLDGMIRECREETKLKIPTPVLKGSIVTSKLFDKPGRSARGRTITHAFLIELKPGKLPAVKGSDDAKRAFWMPIAELTEETMFEDHYHIINNLINHI